MLRALIVMEDEAAVIRRTLPANRPPCRVDCDLLGDALGCVLSSSRRQNRRYDFDTFGVSRADLFFYSRDLPSISAFSILL
ncbi:hypothetical protein, partial [Slackia isoflavoniconvertens]|uniref:hypothetical protein n=1 Tax=Slackia isoflavoniconvertens TaxID=572010 RepID=UPI002E77EA5B